MITEDYVSFETAKLLKEKGFDEVCSAIWRYWEDGIGEPCFINSLSMVDERGYPYCYNSRLKKSENDGEIDIACPTLQMAIKWLREAHNVLVIPDYDYEFTYESYCYKIYKLGENGKPERVPMEGIRYDTLGIPCKEIVAYRDYKKSYSYYKTYEEACEAGIRHCLENLI